MAGQQDDGVVHPLIHELRQQRQAADAGHAHVEHDGAYAFSVEPRGKRQGIGPGLHAQANGGDEQRQAAAHCVVIVH
ncbi:hypothetical protein ALISP_2493 [Alicycliphilus sp. B1]|nr:hypothetical protein ALISP_2493 [Alicycliphilus sp. B1]